MSLWLVLDALAIQAVTDGLMLHSISALVINYFLRTVRYLSIINLGISLEFYAPRATVFEINKKCAHLLEMNFLCRNESVIEYHIKSQLYVKYAAWLVHVTRGKSHCIHSSWGTETALVELELNVAWRYWAYPAEREDSATLISHIRQAEASFWKDQKPNAYFAPSKRCQKHLDQMYKMNF